MAAGLRLGYLPQGDQLSGTVGEIVFGAGACARAPPGKPTPGRARSWPSCCPGSAWTRRPGGCPAASGGGSRSPRCWWPSVTCCCSTSPPTTWTSRRSTGSAATCATEAARSSWSATTAGCWTPSASGPGRSTAARCTPAEGGYSAYVLAQAERERSEEAAERRRRNLARKELAWLQRGARARTTKAKFRVEAANALIAAEPPPRDSVELTRLATARLGKTVIELEDVTVSAGDRPLLDRVTWRLGPGDRVGIVGVNGSGKTSLLRVLDGEATARPGAARGGHDRQGQDRAAGPPVPGARRARPGPAGPRGGGGDPAADPGGRPRAVSGPAAGAARLHRGTAVDQGRRPVRRRAAPGPDAPAADDRTQRAAARRADQRPGHRDADRARGPARRLARHAGGGQPRPVLPRAGDRARGGAARRRQALLPRRRGGRVPGPGPGRPPRARAPIPGGPATGGIRRGRIRRPRRSAPRARNCSASSASWTG